MVPLSETQLERLHAVETQRREFYTGEAPVYDGLRYENFGQRLTKELLDATLFDTLAPRPGRTILDVATGTGRAAVELSKRGATVYGVDLTDAMLSELRAKIARDGLDNIHLYRASARDLPFPDSSFDAVVSLRFLHLIPVEFQRLFLDEMLRVLKPGGRLVVSFNNPLFKSGQGFLEYERARLRGLKLKRSYLWPRQERALFRGVIVERRIGSWFPGISKVGRLNRSLGLAYGRFFEQQPVVNRLSEQLLFVCRKAG